MLSLGLLLALGTLTSTLAALSWRSAVATDQQRAFATTATSVADTLTMSLQRDADVIATVRTLVADNPTIGNAQFEQWFTTLGSARRYPGSFAFAFVQAVTPAQLPGFVATTSADPPAGIPHPHPFALNPPGTRARYCLMRLTAVELPAGAAAKVGALDAVAHQFLGYLDPDQDECMGSQAPLLARAEHTGNLTVGSFSSVLDEVIHSNPAERNAIQVLFGNLSPIELVEPVYAHPTAPGSHTTGPLLGWVGGIFDAQALLAPVLDVQRGMSFVLADRLPGGGTQVFSRVGHPVPGDSVATIALKAEGGWVVQLAAKPGGGVAPATQAWIVFLVGLLITALVLVLVDVLTRSRQVALALVEEKTGELRYLAMHDALTGLPNRTLVLERTDAALSRCRGSGDPVALLFVDLDGFKDVNDAHGHAVGDQLLRSVASRLSEAIDPSDTIGRLGGDEFVVLAGPEAARRPRLLADRLLATCALPFHSPTLPGTAMQITASIGIATDLSASAGELLADADIALYRAKATGKGVAVLFEPAMRSAVTHRIDLDNELRTALTEGQFSVVYQPIHTLATMDVLGLEALVRWRHPERGTVLPNQFIPALEASGLIVDVGLFVMSEACHQAARLRDLGYPLTMSVNLSARQLEHDTLVTDLDRARSAAGLDPRALVAEITETALMHDPERVARTLRELSMQGIRVAIDDFGTGYSSLAYLHRFPANVLKIDRSFVANLVESPETAALVHAIVQLGKALGLSVLAEGIEDRDQLRLLLIEGCHSGQGNLFSEPLEADVVVDYLRGRTVIDPTHPAGATTSPRSPTGATHGH